MSPGEYPVQVRRLQNFSTGSAPIAPTLLVLAAAWLSGCASQAQVDGSWAGNAPRDQSFKKVLVVGVSPDIDQRCPFERTLAARIQSASTTAIMSCAVVDRKAPLTRESIEAAVASQQADAVVATVLVSNKFETEEGGSRETRGGGMYKATDSGYASGYYGAYGVPVVYGEFQTAPSLLTMKGEVHLTTRIYETRNATLVYTIDTVARDIESRASGLDVVTTPIADRLRKDGLIR